MASHLGPVLFAVAGVALAVGARWWRYHEAALARPAQVPVAPVAPAPVAAAPVQVPAQPQQPAAPLPPVLQPAAVAAEPQPLPSAVPPFADEPKEAAVEAPVEVPLTTKERRKLDKGQGLLEIVTGKNDDIAVDGRRVGAGPVQRVVVIAGTQPHEVRVKMRGEERVRYVLAKDGAKLRVRVAPPWSQ